MPMIEAEDGHPRPVQARTMDSTQPTTVAFVELPDEALDILSHYTQDPGFNVTLVVSMEPDSYAIRMADILKVDILDVPNRLTLSMCDRIIVGPAPDDLVESIREMMDGTTTEVWTIPQVLETLGDSVRILNDEITSPSVLGSTDDAITQVVDPDDLTIMSEDPQESDRTTELQALPTESLDVVQPGESAHLKPAEDEPSPEDEIWRIWSGEEPEEGLGLVHGPVDPDGEPLPEKPEPREPSAAPAAKITPPLSKATKDKSGEAEITASPEPESAIQHRFDVGALLGEDLRDEIGALMLDTSRGDLLNRILDMAIRATHAQTGSIMLLDEDGTHLRIAVAEGLPLEVVASVRQRVGEGVAGQVFSTGRPQIVRGRVRSRGADRGLRPELREGAVVPILNDGRTIGVLSVNSESERTTLNESSLDLLGLFAKEVSAAVLKAIDLARLEGNTLREALLRHVERLMALEESLPHRLRAVADAVARTFSAEIVHVFLVDPLGKRLETITPRRGMGAGAGSFISMDQGLLGWIVRHQTPRVFETWTDDGSEGVASFFIPIGSSRGQGLMLLENLPLKHRGAERFLATLSEIMDRVADMIEVEKSLEAQELLSQLQIRVAERSAHFAGLLPHERTRAVLEFTTELLAADTAVWEPTDAAAVWARPGSTRIAALQRRFKEGFPVIADWILDQESAAGGFELPGWSAEAPTGAAPYLGIRVAGAGGVLAVIFAEGEDTGPLAQAPPEVLFEVLRTVGAHLPPDLGRRIDHAA